MAKEEARDAETEVSDLSWALRQVLVAAGPVNLVVARRLGLSLNDLAALDHLLAHQPLGPAELGARLGVRPASATALVDRLEGAGHVRRRPHPTDRRRQIVEVTPEGESASAAVLRPLIADLDEVAAGLPHPAHDAVLDYLRAVTAVLHRHDRVPGDDPPSPGQGAGARGLRL